MVIVTQKASSSSHVTELMLIQGSVDSEKTVFQFLRRKTKEIPPEQTDETSLRDTEQPS
jgi:hypothetical protein